MLTICLSRVSLASQPKAQKRDKPLIVAVIDTGVDIKHTQLKKWIWSNPKECGLDGQGIDRSSNKIDDDNNGYVDDCHGWNFAGNNSDLQDINGHGTHVSGIIVRQYLASLSGVSSSKKMALMPIRYFSGVGDETVNIRTTVAAIKYAVQMGASIINYSSGGYSRSSPEAAALMEASRKGVLIVTAAGNHGKNIDHNGFYPAAYSFSNVISVASTGQPFSLMEESNYGKRRVDVSAPGLGIISTLPNNQFGQMSGTSQATAFVTGALAVLIVDRRAQSPRRITRMEVRSMLNKIGVWNKKLEKKTSLGLYIEDATRVKKGQRMPAEQRLAESIKGL